MLEECRKLTAAQLMAFTRGIGDVGDVLPEIVHYSKKAEQLSGNYLLLNWQI